MEYLLIYLSIGFSIGMILVRYNPMKVYTDELPVLLFCCIFFWWVIALVFVGISGGKLLVSLARIGRKP